MPAQATQLSILTAAPEAISVVQREANSLLAGLEPESAQVIFTDPPYGIAYHSNHYKGDNPHAPVARDWNFQIGPFLQNAAIALKDTGAIYLCTRWDVYPLWAMSVPPPLSIKNMIVWVKDNWSAGDLEGDFGNQYEILMLLTKGRHLRRGYRWSNIWNFARVPAKRLLCPVQKPVDLVKRAIESSSDVGDLIVDPFCGSGTTGVAALACGRRSLLGDIDPNMVRIACDRVGLPVPAGIVTEPLPMPACPVFNVVPPSPSMWGLHPEDLAYAAGKDGSNA